MNMADVDEVGVGADGDHEDETVGRLPSKNLIRAMGYLTPNARQPFTQLRQVFIKAPILRHFGPGCHIQVETDASGYAIGDMLSQLTDFSWWQPVAYYFRKIIPAKTRYKTHNAKLLAIVEPLKHGDTT